MGTLPYSVRGPRPFLTTNVRLPSIVQPFDRPHDARIGITPKEIPTYPTQLFMAHIAESVTIFEFQLIFCFSRNLHRCAPHSPHLHDPKDPPRINPLLGERVVDFLERADQRCLELLALLFGKDGLVVAVNPPA